MTRFAYLSSHFAPFGPIVYVKIPPGKGCGFVSYVHRQSAEQAISQLNGTLLGGNRVRLSWGRSNASLAGFIPSGATPISPTWKSNAPFSPVFSSNPASPASSPEKAFATPSPFMSPAASPAPVSNSTAMLREPLDEMYHEFENYIWKQDSFYLSLSDAGMGISRPASSASVLTNPGLMSSSTSSPTDGMSPMLSSSSTPTPQPIGTAFGAGLLGLATQAPVGSTALMANIPSAVGSNSAVVSAASSPTMTMPMFSDNGDSTAAASPLYRATTPMSDLKFGFAGLGDLWN